MTTTAKGETKMRTFRTGQRVYVVAETLSDKVIGILREKMAESAEVVEIDQYNEGWYKIQWADGHAMNACYDQIKTLEQMVYAA
jgi:hypothetical protein